MKVLLCCLMLASIPAFSQTLEKDQPQLEATSDPEVFVQKLPDGKHQIEYLYGSRAKTEAQAVKARNKKMFRETEESKQFGQNWIARPEQMVVARWMEIPDNLASETIQSVKGITILYPYDDGINTTYEGKQYVEDYEHPYAFTMKYQMKIPKSGAYAWVNWAKTWEKYGGDGPPKVDHKYLPDGSEVTNVWGTLRSGSEYRSCFLNGMVGGCLTRGVVECAATGPAWAHCFAGKCAVVMLGFSIGCIWVF